MNNPKQTLWQIFNTSNFVYSRLEGFINNGVQADEAVFDSEITIENTTYTVYKFNNTKREFLNWINSKGSPKAYLVNLNGTAQEINYVDYIKRNLSIETTYDYDNRKDVVASYKLPAKDTIYMLTPSNDSDKCIMVSIETPRAFARIKSIFFSNNYKPLIVGQNLYSVLQDKYSGSSNYAFIDAQTCEVSTKGSKTKTTYRDFEINLDEAFELCGINKDFIIPIEKIGQNYTLSFELKTSNNQYSWNINLIPKLSLEIIDDTTFQYDLREKAQLQYDIYVGQPLSEEFYKAFEITKTNHNAYIESTTSVAQNALNEDDATYDLLKQTDDRFVLTYSFQNTEIVKTINKNLHFIDTQNHSQISKVKTDYAIGDTFNYSTYDINVVGNVVYDNGTSIPISKLKEYDPNLIFEVGASIQDGEVITYNTISPIQVTYTITSDSVGILTIPFEVNVGDVSQNYVNSVNLIDYKNHFKYNEVIEFGPLAKLELINSDNQVLKVLELNEFQNLVVKDNKYGNQIRDGLLTDNEIHLINYYNNHQFTQTIRVSYASDLVLNINDVKKKVYFDETFQDFDYSGLKAHIKYHYLGSIENREINFSDLNITHEPFDNSQSKTYSIKVSTIYEERTLESAFQIQAIKKEPNSISVNGKDTTIYYDNNNSKFALPSGLTFTLHWNDGATSAVEPSTDLKFYRDENCINELHVGDLITKKDGLYIYCKHKTYNVVGRYLIEFKVDSITLVEMTNDVSIPLGNYLRNYKPLVNIKVTYLSGAVDENFYDWTFKEINRVDKPLSIVNIVINNEEYQIHRVTFTNPKILSIIINQDKFHTSFNNTNDNIDCRVLSFKVNYENSEYVQLVNKYVKEVINENNEFSVTCSDLPDFTFDGSENINFSMPPSELIHNTKLQIKIRNVFSPTEFGTIDIPIQIVEITNITGMKLIQAKTKYKTGESFLNETDNTQILIFYKMPTGEENKILINLNSGFSAVNIFPLKGTIFYNQDKNKTIRVSSATNANIYVEYSIEVLSEYEYHNTTSHQLRVVRFDKYTLPNGETKNLIYLIVNEKDTTVENGIRKIRSELSQDDIKVYGFLDDINDVSKNARMVLLEDYIPIIDGESNITITYPCYVEGNSDIINKCHFGQLFGNNNSKNRLFLSGNPDYPNADWHSGAVNETKQDGEYIEVNGDFTYFEDTSAMNYGQSDNKIVGYDIVSDGKMIVFKDKSDKEPTIYYRTNGLINALDASGNAQIGIGNRTLYEENYPLVIGNSKGVGALHDKSIINFNGNTLFLSSENELDMLVVSGQIGDSQRFASTISYFINPILSKCDLTKSFLWTDDKYLYLINKNHIFATYYDQIIDNNFEWWKLDIPNVSSMLSFDNKTYYGTTDGTIGLFENNIHKDITKIFLPKGSVILNTDEVDGDKVTITKSAMNLLDNGYLKYFKVDANQSNDSSYLYYFIAELNNTKSGNVDIYINGISNKLEIVALRNGVADNSRLIELRNLIHEDDAFYLNNPINESEIQGERGTLFKEYYRKYKLKVVPNNLGENTCFGVYDYQTNQRLDVSELFRASLCKRVDDLLEIVELNKEESTFKLKRNGQKLDLVRYANQEINQTFNSEIWLFKDVKAHYITAPITMGDMMHDKTLWGYTLSNDTNIPSELELCQICNEEELIELTEISTIEKSDYELDLNKFSLTSLSFDKVDIPHKTTFYKPILVPFVCFCFKNDKGTNSVLSTLSISYSIAKKSYGSY